MTEPRLRDRESRRVVPADGATEPINPGWSANSETIQRRAWRKLAESVPLSLSAVSEAPEEKGVPSGTVNGRFRYSDLKEAAPHGSPMGFVNR